MGFQFVHIESYSRKADSKGRSTSFVLDEAERKPGSCEHVEKPGKPVTVFGLDVSGVRVLHDERCAEARSEVTGGKARKVRQDQHTMLTIVASHPATSHQVCDDAVTKSDVAAWQARTVDWLRNQWGDRLVSVIRHDDESHPHLHAYVLPDGDMKAKSLHPGAAAKAVAKAEATAAGLDPKAATAYKTAMRHLQDSFFEQVGLASGQARLGPGRRRLERDEWRAEQAGALAAARALEVAGAARAQAMIVTMQARDVAVAAEAKAVALAENGRRFVEQARAAAAAAKAQADASEGARAAAVAEVHRARRVAGSVVRQAKVEARRLTAEAELKAVRLRGLGERLAGVWSGFAGVARRLERRATERVAQAEARASAAVSVAKAEARGEVGGELAALHLEARRAELAAEQAQRRAREAEAALRVEREARSRAETEREDFRSRWAVADNAVQAASKIKRGRAPMVR